MDHESDQDGKKHQADGQDVHQHAAFLERMEETGTDLQADGKDEED